MLREWAQEGNWTILGAVFQSLSRFGFQKCFLPKDGSRTSLATRFHGRNEKKKDLQYFMDVVTIMVRMCKFEECTKVHHAIAN